ncbi:MAG: MFS transporter [Kosmotogaceae bacterium]|nr:MFS transporter [Kosmotogaceae bacterium]
MNRIIKLLLISDIFVLTGFGLMQPILAIFIKDELIGGSIFSAGIASMIFIVAKSAVQLPFSRYVDRRNRVFEVRGIILGTLMISIVPFIYIFSNHIKFIYLAQTLYGIGAGLAYPAWFDMWTRNLDKKNRSYEWSLYSTMTGLGTGAAAIIGATVAEFLGFTYTFLMVGCMSLIGCIILIRLENILPHRTTNTKKNKR